MYICVYICVCVYIYIYIQKKARRDYTQIITAVVSKYGGIRDYFILQSLQSKLLAHLKFCYPLIWLLFVVFGLIN